MTDQLKHTCCCNSPSVSNQNEAFLKHYRSLLPGNILAFIDQCMQQEHASSNLIAVLHKVQEHFGYLAPQTMDAVAYLMQIPAAKVSGVASFYHYFRLKPCGKFVISICLGTACYVKGSEEVLNKFKLELGINEGEMTNDGLFTLEVSRCLGTCALAPVVKIGDEIYSQMTPDKVPSIIESYLKKAKESTSKGVS